MRRVEKGEQSVPQPRNFAYYPYAKGGEATRRFPPKHFSCVTRGKDEGRKNAPGTTHSRKRTSAVGECLASSEQPGPPAEKDVRGSFRELRPYRETTTHGRQQVSESKL